MTMDIKKAISEININIDSIADPAAKSIIIHLLNIIEELAKDNKILREENQKLRDEINRLKGEQGKPNIRGQSKDDKKAADFSSENERKRPNKNEHKKNKENRKIRINRSEVCKIDKEKLPVDAIFKGYSKKIVQDINITTDNIEFRKEVYYSPSLKKTFIASLPDGYDGEFGPNIRSLIISLYHDSNMTELKIVDFLKNHNIMIAPSTVSRFLTENKEDFHQEKKDIVEAGIAASEYQQMDDTSARVNGKNYVSHILCNQHFTAYFTRERKDRITILEILSQNNLMFSFNESSYALMERMGLPQKTLAKLKSYGIKESMSRQEIDTVLKKVFPDENKHKTNRRIILEASAITFYQQLANAVLLLLVDDAPQFKQITKLLALCWIHDGRHYKRLQPVINLHRKKLDGFLKKYWDYYHRLLDYKMNPKPSIAKELSNEFDELFSIKTGYKQLDERIEKTKFKKDSLLLVLNYPNLPLHNNASELGARSQARRRDISFQTKNNNGTQAKDTFMTIIETSKKLGINAFDYIRDRVSKKFEMPTLASLIKARAEEKPQVVLYDSS
jgi:hypothetical protein